MVEVTPEETERREEVTVEGTKEELEEVGVMEEVQEEVAMEEEEEVAALRIVSSSRHCDHIIQAADL